MYVPLTRSLLSMYVPLTRSLLSLYVPLGVYYRCMCL